MLPKKSLSQNFLRDADILRNIADEADSSDIIVEIGAGEGALTDTLAQKAKKVVALEFDRDLIPGLLNRFPLSSNVSVVETNILRTDIPETLRKHGWRDEPYALFGNIPYAITGKIIRLLVSLDPAPRTIVLMVQREVAERIVIKNGKQSLLSLAVALFGTPEILFLVPKEAFFPAPRVESAVLRITPDPNRLPIDKRESILRLAKIGFASKRKTLMNNFAAHREHPREIIEKILKIIGKPLNARAEELSKEAWTRLQETICRVDKS
ncbi:MAG: ribosomal RNA small subunit methyltransferase A [Candidatus Moraniibacteriota bacterium]|nr:MAG: ribosomal RNA small subunit methyltransferase A [Candidatus Moranbacteria bacterium]